MTIYVLGASSSKLYKNTTPTKFAEDNEFKFIKSLNGIVPVSGDILIRYGKSDYPDMDYLFDKVINYSRTIKLSSNKINCSLFFKQKDIPTPQIFLDKTKLKEEDMPVLRRLKYHARGSDIKLIKNLNEMKDGDYYSKFIESKCEYRIHVFDGKVIRLQLKVKTDNCTQNEYIHNYENGYLLKDRFEHDIELEKSLIPIAEKAVIEIGLDFGAVDILVGKDDKPYILEVNSAARLNKYGRQLFSFYIKRKLGMEPKIEDYSRIRKNEGNNFNGLPLEFREIIIKEKKD